jgi:hypothetical protein
MSATVNPATSNKDANISRTVSSADDSDNGRNTTSHVSNLAAAPHIRSPYIGTYRPRATCRSKLVIAKIDRLSRDAHSGHGLPGSPHRLAVGRSFQGRSG